MIKFKKLDSEAVLPVRKTELSAGFDICALKRCVVKPGDAFWVHTGIACAIPVGYVGRIESRSSVARKYRCHTVAGTIDADYRGEVVVGIENRGSEPMIISAGQAIAQMLVVAVMLDSEEVEDLDETDRGSGGFGSTNGLAT